MRSLKLEECVLCVKVSPNSRLIAVALLDSTVKVFYLDTLKVKLNVHCTAFFLFFHPDFQFVLKFILCFSSFYPFMDTNFQSHAWISLLIQH